MPITLLFVGLAAFLVLAPPLRAQAGGASAGQFSNRGGMGIGIDREEVERFITISAGAELRVEADQIRAVFALIAEAPTALECRGKLDALRDTLRKVLSDNGILEKDLQFDFIALLPVYDWTVDANVLRERLTGFRLQENLHTRVADEASLRRIIDLLIQNGVEHLLTFDYTRKDLAIVQKQAREQAILAVREKAELLLSLFPERPLLVNVHESTQVLTPQDLYQSFESVNAAGMQAPYNSNMAMVSVPKPTNTFLSMPPLVVDRPVAEALMHAQIVVLSTVTMYFDSPAKVATAAEKQPGGGK